MLFAPVNLELKPRQLALLSGANGTGKTTLMEAIAGIRLLSAGQVQFSNNNTHTWQHHSHYLGHKLGNKGALTCAENLAFVAHINGLDVTERELSVLLASAGLAGYDFQQASDLSAGQKKRLAVCRLLLLNKTFWLLDEPFVNLDHAGCDWLFQLITAHLDQGGAVLITAHDQQNITALAHHHITLEPA